MDKTTIARTALAGGVAGLGLAVGGITIALADDGESGAGTATYTAGLEDRPGLHGPFGGPFGGPGGDAAAELAEKLGVSEDEVTDAFAAIREDLAPRLEDRAEGARPVPPTDEEREAKQGELAAALAEELGVEASAVEDAFAELHDDLQAGVRDSLADRLDDAVGDGDLTEADKASVLKAFDAGVLGFGRFGGPGH